MWDRGSDKSPGPNGFTFEFFLKFWHIVGPDVLSEVLKFFSSAKLSTGCNPSFIALIPKVADAKFVKDFRHISLISCRFKIVGKILANRLISVVGNLVSVEQSAFVWGCQILDGPMILNVLISWCNNKKKKVMFFKVDFEKEYYSVRCDFLNDFLLGFGERWKKGIIGCLSSSRGYVLVNGSPTEEFQFF